MSGTYKLVCPHCHSKVRIRTSEGQHPFLRICYKQCSNEACGWSARAELVTTHELSPSGMANPNIKLPVAPIAMRRQCMAGHKKPELQWDWVDQEQGNGL